MRLQWQGCSNLNPEQERNISSLICSLILIHISSKFFLIWTPRCVNSINGILTIVTPSKNSIRIPCEISKEQLILSKFSSSQFNSTVLSGHSEEHGQDSHSCMANILSECIPQFLDFIQIGHFRSSVLNDLVRPLDTIQVYASDLIIIMHYAW